MGQCSMVGPSEGRDGHVAMDGASVRSVGFVVGCIAGEQLRAGVEQDERSVFINIIYAEDRFILLFTMISYSALS